MDARNDTIRSFDPSRPSELIGEVDAAGRETTSHALASSKEAQKTWKLDAPLRSSALIALGEAVAARRDEFTELMVREVGKPKAEAAGEVQRAVAILNFYAQVALDPVGEVLPGSTPGASVVTRREPLGVVLAICPWNFPLAIPLWKSAPALAYGNTVLIKPATPAVATAKLLASCAEESLPESTLQVLSMSGRQSGDLLDDDRIDGVTFTGSTSVGKGIAERMARRAAPAQAEMGGQNAAVVLADANLKAAAEAIVSGAMGYAGQKCTATRRVVAVKEVAGELFNLISERVRELKVGDPLSDGVIAGPLISGDATRDFDMAVSDALVEGAEKLATAQIDIEAPEAGHFVQPHFLRQDDPHAAVNQKETFGPLLTGISVDDERAAVEAANATDFGLVCAVHGNDLGRAVEVAARIDCGLQRVNAPTPGVDYYAPFGGEKASSYGPREQGRSAREFFTASRTLTILPSPA